MKTKRKKIKKLRKLKKTYPKVTCAFVKDGEQCEYPAVGESTLCARHGGSRVVKENLVDKYHPIDKIHSQYRQDYHPMAFITFSKGGMSPVEVAAEFGVSLQAILRWQEKYLDFNTAYEVGAAMYEAWWLSEARGNLGNSRYNTGLFKYITGNKLGYAEKMESKSLNMNLHGVMVVPDKISEANWEEEAMENGKDHI